MVAETAKLRPNGVRAALAYAKQGFRVVPLYGIKEAKGVCSCTCGNHYCKSPGKHPAIKAWVTNATTNELELLSFAQQWPYANWGIATGKLSGIIVLDIDGRNGGYDSLAKLINDIGELPATKAVNTGSGQGTHLYYRYPLGVDIPKTVLAEYPGIDFESDGGQVVAPPSRHASGGFYEWQESSKATPLADLPPRLIDLLTAKRPKAPPTLSQQVTAPREMAGRKLTPNAYKWLGEALAKAHLYGRNNTAYWLASQLRDDDFSEAEASAYIIDFAERLGDADFDADEALTAAGNAYKAPKREAAKSGGQVYTMPKQKPDVTQAELAPVADAHKDYRLTEGGNAERFADTFRVISRFVPSWKSWLVYDGKRWQHDELQSTVTQAKQIVAQLFQEAAIADDERRSALIKFAAKSDTAYGIKAMLTLAQNELAVTPNDLDRDLWLLNVANGTLDLRTGTLRAHDKDDLITKLAPVYYDPNAQCPNWLRFVNWTTNQRPALAAYLQKAFGYSLTGDVREQVLFLLHGIGANGKSTMVEVFRSLMGDYAESLPIDAIMQTKDGANNSAIARLKGVRFAYAAEPTEGARLNEGLVKQMTGNEVMTARFLYAEPFTFLPAFKLWLSANHAPVVRDSGKGMWRRIRRVPFDARLAEAGESPSEQYPAKDELLKDRLLAELPGILNWALEGLGIWQADGLGTPPEVVAATADYRDDMDTFAHFLADCCVVATGNQVRASELVAVYQTWCKDNNERPLAAKHLASALRDRGFTHYRDTRGILWLGLSLATNTDSSVM